MRVLFIQHDHVSPAGPIAERFEQRGYTVDYLEIVDKDNHQTPNVPATFPSVGDYNIVVPMGAPWGAWEDERIGNWLLPELDYVTACHNAGTPIFGICFGGQLMARALGGSTMKAPGYEIGFTYVWSDDESLIPAGPWFQWHFDRFVVPPRATEIARTSKAPQAFVQGRTLGLQFHPELTGSALELWLDDSELESLRRDGQDPDLLIAHAHHADTGNISRAHNLVDAFLDRIATNPIVL
jgi:GMP synthase-like glutamine amidotransferase